MFKILATAMNSFYDVRTYVNIMYVLHTFFLLVKLYTSLYGYPDSKFVGTEPSTSYNYQIV